MVHANWYIHADAYGMQGGETCLPTLWHAILVQSFLHGVILHTSSVLYRVPCASDLCTRAEDGGRSTPCNHLRYQSNTALIMGIRSTSPYSVLRISDKYISILQTEQGKRIRAYPRIIHRLSYPRSNQRNTLEPSRSMDPLFPWDQAR